ncbi:MAG: hypothetical protein HYT70_04660 [Candidatus Aenigmarchaeota archaeon]|nr:hypothetical protein [Candidatus Aenigmarchaeota archaeon]
MKAAMILLVLLLLPAAVLGHEEVAHEESNDRIAEEIVHFLNVPKYWLLAPIAIISACIAAIIYGETLSENKRIIIFSVIAISTVSATAFLVGQTIYMSMTSWSNGIVHWHADFELWICGEKQTLPDPAGLANRVGTQDVHHHGDYRIHIEGVIVDMEEATLGHFFDVIEVPFSNSQLMEKKNGDFCPDGNPGIVRMYVNGKDYIGDYRDYVIAPYSNVPPGDFIKIVFG